MDSQREDRVPMIAPTKPNIIPYIMRNIIFSWISSLVRIVFIVLIFVLRDILISNNVWSFLFYMLLGLIDVISLIGEVNTYQFLQKQSRTLSMIQEQKQRQQPVTESLRIGHPNIYLSKYESIYQYKFAYRPTASSYIILRYLHLVTTFMIFGSIALKHCLQDQVAIAQTIVLSIMICSVYVVNFEVDYVQLETAKGKYQQIQSISDGVRLQILKKFKLWRKIVFGMYVCLMVFLAVGLICLISSIRVSDSMPIIVTWTLSMVFILINCLYQAYAIRQANDNRLLRPTKIEKVCSVQHLMYEIKGSHSGIFCVITCGMRIALLSLFMSTMYCSSRLNDLSMGMMLAGVCLGVSVEILKIVIGHRSKIDYFTKTNMNNNERVNTNCSICLSNYIEDIEQVELPCMGQHRFHRSCLEGWLKSKEECPLCRYDLGQFMK